MVVPTYNYFACARPWAILGVSESESRGIKPGKQGERAGAGEGQDIRTGQRLRFSEELMQFPSGSASYFHGGEGSLWV